MASKASHQILAWRSLMVCSDAIAAIGLAQ